MERIELMRSSALGTLGGGRVNEKLKALSKDGAPISGLYVGW